MRLCSKIKTVSALVLVGTLLAGCFSGCSVVTKTKKSSDRSEKKAIWSYNKSDEDETDPSIPEVNTATTDPADDIGSDVDIDVTENTEAVTTEPPTEPTTEPPTEPPTTEPEEYFPDTILHPISGEGEIIASVLNIRSGPGMDYEILDGLKRGTRVMIYNQRLVDGEYWGEIYQGWINMQWVAMDDDVIGTWYEYVGWENGEEQYGFWTLELNGDFRYVVYGFNGPQLRQISRSGGTFRMDDYRISFSFAYGEPVTLAGITADIPGKITCNWDVYGKDMLMYETYSSYLTRGTVEKLHEQLQEAED